MGILALVVPMVGHWDKIGANDGEQGIVLEMCTHLYLVQ
jgi:hypothetical protein